MFDGLWFSFMQNNELTSRIISFLRFPLSVGVVFIHSDTAAFHDKYLAHGWLWIDYLVSFFAHTLTSVCVPCFFLISGFLFFRQQCFSKDIYKSKLKSRYHSLLKPYLIWNFIGFLIFLVKMHPLLSSHFPSLIGFRVDIEMFLLCFWDTNLPKEINIGGPIDFPLWYVRDLILLVVFSPAIYWLIRKFKIVFIVIMGVVWFLNIHMQIGIPGLSGQSLFFYPLGAYFAINGIDFVKKSTEVWWAVPVFFIIAVVKVLFTAEPFSIYLIKVTVVIGCVAVFRVAYFLLEKMQIKTNIFLSNASFFLFALHGLLITKFMNISISMIPFESPNIALFLFFVIPVITIFISLYIYKLLLRFPSVAKPLTGGR